MIADRVKYYGNNGEGYDPNSEGAQRLASGDMDYINSEINRATSVLGNRAQAGMDTSKQEDYLNQLIGLKNRGATIEQTNVNMQSENDYRQDYVDLDSYAKQSSNAYLENQKATLLANKEKQIFEIQKAYEDAIAEGKMSVRQAEEAFKKQVAEIEKQTFEDSQMTKLVAQERGIQNSQQYIGMMASDDARKNNLISTSAKDRDTRIADLTDRINAIKAKKDLDIAGTNIAYDASVAAAQAQADLNYSDKMFGLKSDELTFNRNADFSREQDLTRHGYNVDLQNREYKNRVEEMGVESQYRIAEMVKKHEFDLDIIAVELQNDLQKMGVQNSYQLQQIGARAASEAQAVASQYELARQREYDKYKDSNSQEYQIRMAQLNDAQTQDILQIMNKAKATALTDVIMNDPLAQGDYGAPAELSYWEKMKSQLQYPTKYGPDAWNQSLANQQAEVDARNAAIKRKNDFLSNPLQFLQ